MSSHSVNEIANWQSIWRSKNVALDGGDVLTALIKADGFDTGFGDYDAHSWRLMVKDAFDRLNINNSSSVLEIGCGAGAFLYEISALSNCRIFGIDYSDSLINNAKKFIPKGIFEVADANHIPFEGVSFDSILSHGVFFYFPSYEYALEVIEQSYTKLNSGGYFCLMDLNDLSRKGEYHDFRRSQAADPLEYDRKYAGLDHLFFDKDRLTADLYRIGFVQVELFEHRIKSYLNSRFRFNIIMKKS